MHQQQGTGSWASLLTTRCSVVSSSTDTDIEIVHAFLLSLCTPQDFDPSANEFANMNRCLQVRMACYRPLSAGCLTFSSYQLNPTFHRLSTCCRCNIGILLMVMIQSYRMCAQCFSTPQVVPCAQRRCILLAGDVAAVG